MRSAVDREERFLVTASYDKTVRVWEIRTGRLLSTVRVPVAHGVTGRIYAVAISPDSQILAIYAWMRPNDPHVIYLVDRASGRLVSTIEGLPGVVFHLAFSPDGQYLAATARTSSGFRVYKAPDFKEVARGKGYGDRGIWADFSANNELVTTSHDGYIRLYDSRFNLKEKIKAAPNERPLSAIISPDGSRIAVGYANSTRVEVFATDGLSRLFTANAPGNRGSLSFVAWSADGERLYAAGQSKGSNQERLIRQWNEGGRGLPSDLHVPTSTISGIFPLKSGRILIAAMDPHIALLESDGRVVWQHERGLPDFRNQLGSNSIQLSRNAKIVQFGLGRNGADQVRFSLTQAQLFQEPGSDAELSGHLIASGDFAVEDWRNSTAPKLNGMRLPLHESERARSLAISPTEERFVLGTDWYLWCFRKDGHAVWRSFVPGRAWAVNIAPNAKVVVAGFGDGTLRWYRLSDGVELLALFVDPGSGRWIVWTPEGYFAASSDGGSLVGWHTDDVATGLAKFTPLSDLRQKYNRPDVIKKVLDTLDVQRALSLADESRH